jgi:hypothetical protein
MMDQDAFRLEINRVPLYIEGTIKYQLSAVCSVTSSTGTDPVRLDQNVFVKLTSDSSFVRVANASDIGLLKSSVDAASSSGHSEYRDAVATFDFDDVDTAVAAIPVIRDRVNSSVYNYIKYIKRFQSTDEYPNVYSLPLASQDQEAKDSHILNYTDARQARQEAEQSLADSQAALNAIGYKEEFLSDLKNKICALETAVATQSTIVTTANNTLVPGGIMLLVNSLSGSYDPTTATWTLPDAAYTAAKNIASGVESLVTAQLPVAQAAVAQAESALSLECARLGGFATNFSNQTDALKDSLDSLASEVTDSSRVEAAALADLAEYCPDVDPNEV